MLEDVSVALLIGTLSARFIVRRRHAPARLHTESSGLATGGISLGAEFGWNLALE